MPRENDLKSWRYTALSASGGSAQGVIEAVSEAQAIDVLISRRLTPVTIGRTSDGQKAALLNLADRADALRRVGLLLDAKIAAADALQVASSLFGPGVRQRVLGALKAIRTGAPFSEGLAGAGLLTPEEALGIGAGEASGRLPEALRRLADSLARARALRSEMLSAAIYPLILLIALVGTLAVMFGAVLPALIPIFKERQGDLPFATEALLGLHAFWGAWGGMALGLATVLALGGIAWARTPSGRAILDRSKLRDGIWLGLPRLAVGERFSRTLATLLGGGVQLVAALERAAQVQPNSQAREAILIALTHVKGGMKVAGALKMAPVLPETVIELIRVGEETGRLAELCDEAALIMEDAIRTRLKRITVLFTPIATLLLGGLIAFIMSGIVGGIMASSIPSSGV